MRFPSAIPVPTIRSICIVLAAMTSVAESTPIVSLKSVFGTGEITSNPGFGREHSQILDYDQFLDYNGNFFQSYDTYDTFTNNFQHSEQINSAPTHKYGFHYPTGGFRIFGVDVTSGARTDFSGIEDSKQSQVRPVSVGAPVHKIPQQSQLSETDVETPFTKVPQQSQLRKIVVEAPTKKVPNQSRLSEIVGGIQKDIYNGQRNKQIQFTGTEQNAHGEKRTKQSQLSEIISGIEKDIYTREGKQQPELSGPQNGSRQSRLRAIISGIEEKLSQPQQNNQLQNQEQTHPQTTDKRIDIEIRRF